MNLPLSNLDELFGGVTPSTNEPAIAPGAEMVMPLPITDLYMFKDHPFSVVDDKEMYDLADTIKDNGVLVPAIVRPHPKLSGAYEIVAGHRRKRGSELAGNSTMPCIVRNLDDDTATIYMVDSNNQRENVKNSEKARALKMKYEAMKRQGKRNDLTSVQFEQKSESDVSKHENSEEKPAKGRTLDAMAADTGMKPSELQRTIWAADLEGGLKELFDQNKLSLSSAAELASLPPPVQQEVADVFIMEQVQPTLQQAQQIKTLTKEGSLDEEKLLQIVQKPRPQQAKALTLKGERLEKFYTDKFTPAQFEDIVFKALDEYFKRQRRKEREIEEIRAR
jgi:ParB family chromosome partitioning protein